MNLTAVAARFALMLSLCLSLALPAQASTLQCVPYARQLSGIAIYGNAHTWWDQAAERYTRGNEPEVGAVMSFKSFGKMRLGHVAMVSQVVSDREVLLTHANWSRRGGIEKDVRAIDVSEAGDWSAVKVWYGPIGDLGRSVYPVNGFIYSGNAPVDDAVVPNTVIATGGAAPGELRTFVNE